MVIIEKDKQGITIPNPRGNQIKYSPNATKEYVDNKIAEEQQRAELAEYGLTLDISNLQTALDAEITRATDAENVLSTNVNDLQTALNTEITRATQKENELETELDSKITSTEAYDNFVDFSTEQTIQAAKTFKSGINMSNTRIRDLREPNNATDAANKAYVDSVKTDVNNIKDVIPSQASSTNQLADKEFVNSSIATNTANFIGTFNSIDELPTTGVTNNDYAFVVTNNVYSRYKWNETSWLFEYELNNSSFTQEQWETINAGLTSGDTENLRDVVELVSDVVPEDASSTNKLVSTKFLEDRHVILPLLSLEATQEELGGVYNAINNAPQGSAFFISLPEGRGVMPVAIAIGGTSVFAQYADGRYSHELKITLSGGVYLFEKTDRTFATDEDLNNVITSREAEGEGAPALPFATKSEVGDLSQLQTTDKSSIVNAINEVAQGGGSEEWELIEQSTIEGGTTRIERTQTPDGTLYDFSAIMVCLNNKNINFTTANIRIEIDDSNNRYLTAIQGNNSSSNMYKASFERIRGIWESRAIFSNVNGVERMTYFQGFVPPDSRNGRIHKFTMNYVNTAGFAEGAQLYIYAIK